MPHKVGIGKVARPRWPHNTPNANISKPVRNTSCMPHLSMTTVGSEGRGASPMYVSDMLVPRVPLVNVSHSCKEGEGDTNHEQSVPKT